MMASPLPISRPFDAKLIFDKTDLNTDLNIKASKTQGTIQFIFFLVNCCRPCVVRL